MNKDRSARNFISADLRARRPTLRENTPALRPLSANKNVTLLHRLLEMRLQTNVLEFDRVQSGPLNLHQMYFY